MLEELFTSKKRIGILKLLLFTPESLHLREIARRIKTGPIYTRKILDGLKKGGLVLESRKGNLVLFQINKDSPIYEELKRIFLKTQGIGEVLRKKFGKMDVQKAFVYGSFAEGKETGESDVDVFIVGNVEEEKLIREINKLEREMSRQINYTLFSPAEFRRKKKDPFIKNVLRQKKIWLVR